MTQRTFTDADLEQMAAASAASNPVPVAEQKTYAPAARALLDALADGRPATVEELASAAGLTPDEAAAALRAINGVEWDAEGRVSVPAAIPRSGGGRCAAGHGSTGLPCRRMARDR